jgi:hypothetical protein
MIKVKAFRTFIRVCSVFRSDRLSANIKLTLHKALIMSVMTYACPAWEFAADIHFFFKLQHLRKRFSAPLAIFQGAHWSAICVRLSKFCTSMISLQNYAGSKQKSYKIIITQMFAI